MSLALAEQHRRFDAALAHMSQGLCILDQDLTVVVVNRRYLDIYGLSPDHVKPGVSMREVLEHSVARGNYRDTTADELYERFRTDLERCGSRRLERELADGRVIAISQDPMPGGGWVGTYDDVTERVRGERALAQQNDRFQAAINNMSQGLVLFDDQRRLVVTNEPYLKMYGLSEDVVRPGITIVELITRIAADNGSTEDLVELIGQRLSVIEAGVPETFTRELSDGRVISVKHQPLGQGGWVATHEDVTERKLAEARITHMARHDALTGLPNRTLLREKMEDALARVRRGETLAVLCLDLDHFKAVNDAFGHSMGDRLLQEVTTRLHGCLRETDVVARLGGDEFAILQVGLDRFDSAGLLARRVIEALGGPYELGGHHVAIGTSIGVAFAPSDGLDPDTLLKRADMALYKAKADGRGTYHFFEEAMDARLQERRLLETGLRRALLADEFELHYQPQVDARTDAIVGFEALVRWRHPERGLVSPADFIPLTEEIGLIVPLGRWVLEQACREAATWPGDVRIAVNLSPAQFRSRTLVETVTTALGMSGLAPHRLELEITETVLLVDDDQTLATLHQLRELGVRIALDDFGTGYSSLSYLRSFPFDKIKIDRSFILGLAEQRDCLAIIKAIAGLGASMGMATTAEGVETVEQLKHVRDQGCTEVQGYLFSRPRPAAELAALFSTAASSKAD